MKKRKKIGILVDGSIRSAGVTFYTRDNQTVVRSSVSMQPHRCSAAQFDVRQRLYHNLHLWTTLRPVSDTLLTRRQFFALAASLPPVYLTREALASGTTLLLPGIPVACGPLPMVEVELGSVDGTPALLFSGPAGAGFLLVTLRQIMPDGVQRLVAETSPVDADSLVEVGGRWALVGDTYGDTTCGWALVRRHGTLCSTARVVTASTAYREYQTSEALTAAADSYGGLTPP